MKPLSATRVLLLRHTVSALLLFVCVLPALSQSANQPATSARQIFIVPFSHFDLFWACTREECLSRGNFVISKAIQLAKQHRDYRYLLESEVFVANFVESHRGTSELEDFKRLVAEGRIEVSPLWAGIYQNQTPEEALVRNLLLGKRYANEVFRVDPKVANLTDIPGFTQQYPQILKKSNTPYLVMTRMGPHDVSLFHWKAPDGSSVLTWNTINGYGWGVGLELHKDLTADRINSVVTDIHERETTASGPIFLGWGTDLFAPNEQLIDNVAALNRQLAPLQFRLSTSEDFFRAAEKTAQIPELQGEIPSSWANLTTSLVPLWPPAVEATNTLVTAEKFAAINYALGYSDYPSQAFNSLWKLNLESLDHNNDGQGGTIGDERKFGYAQEAELGAGQILRDSLRNIAERVKHTYARCTPIVVFNPLNWKRDDAVEAHVTLFGNVETPDIDDYKAGMSLFDANGSIVPFEVEQFTDGSSRSLNLIFVARGVPSLGYKTYYLVPGSAPQVFEKASQVKIETDADAKDKNDVLGEDLLENEFYRISIERATGRINIFDKELNRFVTKGMEIIGTEEKGGDDQNIYLRNGRLIANVIDSIDVEENSTIRTVLAIHGNVGEIPIEQRITLWRGIKKIDLANTIHWMPGHAIDIDQVIPLPEHGASIRNGVPFGSIAGSDIMKNSGPTRDDEVAPEIWKHWRQIQNWVFAGTSELGFTLSADHALIEVDDAAIKADMLRGTRFNPTTTMKDGKLVMDLRPPAGDYVFHYSLTSGRGDWSAAKSWRDGMSFRAPFIPVISVDSLSAKPLPPETSFLTLNQDNLVVTAMKKSENDNAIILRSVEMNGNAVETSVNFLGKQRDLKPVNLLEEDAPGSLQKTQRSAPFEIDTVKLPLPLP
jgi:alpha-mannosidase